MLKKLAFKYFKYNIIQYKWGRKWLKGRFYYVGTPLPMHPFWTDNEIKINNLIIFNQEEY